MVRRLSSRVRPWRRFLVAVPAASRDAEPDPDGARTSPDSTRSPAFAGPSRTTRTSTPQPGDTPEEAVASSITAEHRSRRSGFVIAGRRGERLLHRDRRLAEFADPTAVDLDIYVYRIRDERHARSPTRSRVGGNARRPRVAGLTRRPIAGQPLKPRRRTSSRSHNFCSNDTDPGRADGCAAAATPTAPSRRDEDDAGEATVTFTPLMPANKRPAVSLSGPTTGTHRRVADLHRLGLRPGRVDQQLRVRPRRRRASSRRTRAGGLDRAARRSPAAGLLQRRRARDRQRRRARPSRRVHASAISGPRPAPGAPTTQACSCCSSFKLNRPVFGGRKNRKLVVQLPAARGRAARSSRSTAARSASSAFRRQPPRRTAPTRSTSAPKKLRKGATYTVRMSVRSADGKRTQSARLSAKRL